MPLTGLDSVIAGAIAGGLVSLALYGLTTALAIRQRRQTAANLIRLEIISNMTVAALLLDAQPKKAGATVDISTEFFWRFAADLRGMAAERFVNVASLSLQTGLVRVAVEQLRSGRKLHSDDEEFLRGWLKAADLTRKILDLEASGWKTWLRKRSFRNMVKLAVKEDMQRAEANFNASSVARYFPK